MRPHDIVVLLKIILIKGDFLLKDLSEQLFISRSEITKSVERSINAGLLTQDKKTPIRKILYDFIIYGLPVVFPTKPMNTLRGMPTAHSAPPLNKEFRSEELFVWADPKGEVRGQQIEPLYKGQVEAAKKDEALYEMLTLIDALRVGKAREKEIAKDELKKRILL